MLLYALRRLIYLMPVAFGVSLLVFALVHLAPGDPISAIVPPDAPKEQLAALHKHLGFSRAVLVQASCHGTDNSAMLDAIAASNGGIRGVAMVGKDVTDRELERLHSAGVRGARFNFGSSGFSIGGSNGRSNLITVDGGENEYGSGQLRFFVSPEAVQEFQVNRNGTSAENGFTSGTS